MYYKGKEYDNRTLFKIREKMVQELNDLKLAPEITRKKQLSKNIKTYLKALSKRFEIPVNVIKEFLRLRVMQHMNFLNMIGQDLELKAEIENQTKEGI
jgi:hypothetical protein